MNDAAIPETDDAEAKPFRPRARGLRAISVGNLVGVVVGLIVVYFAWGYFFTRGGTAANVVLGLLMAVAVVYLVSANFGPFFDDVIYRGERGKGRALYRAGVAVYDDLERTLRDARRGRGPIAAGEIGKVTKLLRTLAVALLEYETSKGSTTSIDGLEKTLTFLEENLRDVFAQRGGSVFSQVKSLSLALFVAIALRAFFVEPFQIPSGSMIPTLLIGDHLFVARCMYGVSLPFVEKPKYLLRWSTPTPGDVVVFVAPPYVQSNAGEDWIKRVIAGPGQRVRIVENVIEVDGKPYTMSGDDVPVPFQDYQEGVNRWTTRQALLRRESVVVSDGEIRAHDTFLADPTPKDWPLPFSFVRGAEGLTCDDDACTVDDGFIFVMGDNRDHSNDGRRWGAVPIDNVKGRALFIWMSVDGSEESVSLGRFWLPEFRWERIFQGIE